MLGLIGNSVRRGKVFRNRCTKGDRHTAWLSVEEGHYEPVDADVQGERKTLEICRTINSAKKDSQRWTTYCAEDICERGD